MNSDVHGFKQMFDVRQAFERQNTRTLLGHANIWDRKEKAERLQSSTRSFLFIDYPKSYISSLYISRTVCVCLCPCLTAWDCGLDGDSSSCVQPNSLHLNAQNQWSCEAGVGDMTKILYHDFETCHFT